MQIQNKLTLLSHCSLDWVPLACILSWHDCESVFDVLHTLRSMKITGFLQMLSHEPHPLSTAHLSLFCRYSNQVVAKLPFEPHWMLAKVAHRGLKFPEANDCAVVCCMIEYMSHSVAAWLV